MEFEPNHDESSKSNRRISQASKINSSSLDSLNRLSNNHESASTSGGRKSLKNKGSTPGISRKSNVIFNIDRDEEEASASISSEGDIERAASSSSAVVSHNLSEESAMRSSVNLSLQHSMNEHLTSKNQMVSRLKVDMKEGYNAMQFLQKMPEADKHTQKFNEEALQPLMRLQHAFLILSIIPSLVLLVHMPINENVWILILALISIVIYITNKT